jgi:hypothetical protein
VVTWLVSERQLRRQLAINVFVELDSKYVYRVANLRATLQSKALSAHLLVDYFQEVIDL